MLVVGNVLVVGVAMHEDGRQLGDLSRLGRLVLVPRRLLVVVVRERVRPQPGRFRQGCGDQEEDDCAEFLPRSHDESLCDRARPGQVGPAAAWLRASRRRFSV